MELFLFKDPLEATFVARLNRFVVECLLEGKRVRAYLPNPGRLWELLLPGATLILEPARRRQTLPYTVVAVEREGYPVMVHTHRTNHLAAFLVEREAIPGLEGFRVVKTEVPWRNSRFDLLLENKRGERVLTEVKSVTLYSHTIAMFPDAPTTRGVRHLRELENPGNGLKGAIVFVVFSPQARYFLPEFHIDPLFATTLMKIRERVDIIPIGVELTEALSVRAVARPLAIPWHIVEKEAHDGGAYMLLLRAEGARSITTGERTLELEEGYYIYVGSARRGLTERLLRHMRKTKRASCHMDYMRAVTRPVKTIPIRTKSPIECELSERLQTLFSSLHGIGSSDCRCPAHLFYTPTNPLEMPEFIGLILHYRMDRLIRTDT